MRIGSLADDPTGVSDYMADITFMELFGTLADIGSLLIAD